MKTSFAFLMLVSLFAQQRSATIPRDGLFLSTAWNRTAGPPNVQACLQIACAGASISRPGQSVIVASESGRRFRIEAVATNLDTVWDLVWGPEGQLWFTERGGRISRMDLRTRSITLLTTLPVEETREGGLLGLALHPDFPQTPWVYAVGTFKGKNRLVRLRYENDKLGTPETLIDGIAGNSYHNGSRLVFGPDRLLYMSMGEAGSDSKAQDARSLSGKILRLTAEGKPAPENPFGNEVWSMGHRNPQGLVFQRGTGALYSTEHGDVEGDEINLIEKGKNYGWPKVRGACNDKGEKKFCDENKVVEPVGSFIPPVAPSGADFYNGTLFQGWDGNLLIAALGRTSLYRITLTADGRRAAQTEQLFHYQFGRLRDVLTGPDGSIYLATSNRDSHFLPEGLFEGDDKILRVTPER